MSSKINVKPYEATLNKKSGHEGFKVTIIAKDLTSARTEAYFFYGKKNVAKVAIKPDCKRIIDDNGNTVIFDLETGDLFVCKGAKVLTLKVKDFTDLAEYVNEITK